MAKMKPRLALFAPDITKAKVKYLEQGFRELDIGVAYDRRLNASVIDSEIYPFEVIFGPNHKVNCILDITASRLKVHKQMVEEREDLLYFKTHLARTDLQLHPRIFPMPQSTSNLRYFGVIEKLRKQKKEGKQAHDLLAIFVNSDAGLRTRVVEKIREGGWNALAWMIKHPRLPRAPIDEKLTGPKLRYTQHLDLQSRTKLCLALPGARKNQGASISFRHVEIWGMGGLVFTIRPGTVLVGNPKRIEVEFRQDLSDFNKKVRVMLGNDEKRKEIEARGLEYFLHYLTPKAHARHVLKKIKEVGI